MSQHNKTQLPKREDAEYYISPCSEDTCINGPPTIETYVLCDVCAKVCPDVFDFGRARMPTKWLKLKSKKDKAAAAKDRKSSNISAYVVYLMAKKKSSK